MKFAAVIFDLDGTIIKSEDVWGKAYLFVLQNLGVNVSTDPHIPGMSLQNNWRKFLIKYNIKTAKTVEELEILTYTEYEKMIPQITLNDGVLEFMDVLRENNTPLALATSTNWDIANKIINHFGLTGYFENITTGEEVENPKPDPEIFIVASEKLGIDPVDCLVIEDSESGINAAHEAGMKVIAISCDGADLVVESFSEITLKAIDGINQD